MHPFPKPLCALVTLVTLIGLAALPTAATAQRPIELGIDGAISWSKFEPPEGAESQWQTEVEFPVSNFRIGFLTTDRRWSVEPNLAFARSSLGDASASRTQLDVGLLYHFAVATARDPGKPQPYLRPFLGFAHSSFSGLGNEADNSETVTRLGLGLGVKLPMIDRLAGRLEARYVHVSEGDVLPSNNAFALGFGLSFFTR
jgi:hypothetical protein